MEPLACVELSSDAPAEVLRLLPLVGLEPVIDADANGRAAALCVHFDGIRRVVKARTMPFAPASTMIAFGGAPPDTQAAADFVTDSAIAATCFILSRVLGIAPPFLTADATLFDVMRTAIALARGDARVLIEGEIGVGKESLIKLIYSAGCSAAGLATKRVGHAEARPSVNFPGLLHAECAGLAEDTVDAEIAPLLAQAASFGRARPGGAAIFFNRIGELPPAAQRRLLILLRSSAVVASDHEHTRAASSLHERRGARVEGRRAVPANVRILAASTRTLAAMRASGEMLAELHDLFDTTLMIAPLRTRRGDLPLLVHHYLRTLDRSLTLNAAALRALSAYPFPGNVLELVNFVTRVAIGAPLAGPRRTVASPPAGSVVGRAEVVRQLDRGSLNTIWHSRDEWNSRIMRTRGKKLRRPLQPVSEITPAEGPAANSDNGKPASMHLTTGALAPQRKPRGGHPGPRA